MRTEEIRGLLWTYIITIDVLKFKDADEWFNWNEEYHPKNYTKFWAWNTKRLTPSTFELWLPIKEGNKNRKKSNICVAQKDIDSWLKVYNRLTGG